VIVLVEIEGVGVEDMRGEEVEIEDLEAEIVKKDRIVEIKEESQIVVADLTEEVINLLDIIEVKEMVFKL
jgi:hypothetical protein